MLLKRFLFIGIFLGLWVLPLKLIYAENSGNAIVQVMKNQVSAWNEGDIDKFMKGYKNSPETTFIGKNVKQGWQQVLERYKHDYKTKERMGIVAISNLSVRPLDANFALMTGNFHLARNADNGGNVSGIFSLVWEKTSQGWKIILDHTST